jgi:hypothetical protein
MQPVSQIPPRDNLGFYPAEFRETRSLCYVPAGFDLNEALKPAFWVHLGYKLKPGDAIDIFPDDMAWEASVRVIEAGPMWARVALRYKLDLRTQSDDASALSIEWAGPHAKHRVLRGKDVLKDGFAKKADAQHWIDTEYLANSKAA